MRKIFPFLLFAVVLTTSCNIQKRLYRSGFYVAANQRNGDSKHDASIRIQSDTQICQADITQIEMKENDSPKTNTLVVNQADQQEDKDVAMKSANLSSTGFVSSTNTKPTTWEKFEIKPKHNKAKKKNVPDEGKSGDKSQLVAFLLCFFFGLLGIHRFYLGYVGIGLLELFTLGCFGILTLIDLFMIAFGVLKPKNGNYK